ncbi:MAG: GDP-mannose 4,6-dehydratase [Smithella sp.]|jgi:GDPmannose 4,6-dehydratase
MLQQESPDDYVIATGEQHSVREFVEMAFNEIGITVRWEGKGVGEKGYNDHTGKVLLEVDKRYFRPTEVETLLGDPSKAAVKLGWRAKVGFNDLVAEMVREDIKDAERDILCKNGGYSIFRYHE